MPTHLQRLGEWAARVDSVPDDVRRAARAQAIDMVAAVHATARTGAARPVLRALESLGAGGHATSLADGSRFAPVDAAFANAALSMAHDYDDIVWMGHTGHSAVFASLAVGEHVDARARDVVDAIAVANEIGGRLGASSILGPLNGQMWTFIHLACAAAATARLLRLDAATTTHALSIALAQPNFALQPGFLRPTSKLLAASTPTATGIRAAFFARDGMTGAPEILEDARGFWKRFAFLALPEMLSADLGQFWVLRALAVKTYPGCHYFQTALAAIERILSRRGDVPREAVARVRIDTTKLACEATRFAGEYVAGSDPTPVSVNFDLATSAAVMLCARTLGVEQLEESWLREHASQIRAWRSIVAVVHDPELTARTIASSRRVRAGRSALRALPLRALPSLARKYGQEYRSTLASPREIAGLLRAALRPRRTKRAPPPAPHDAIALAFPNRVTIDFADGSREVALLDVPAGALASPSFEQQLGAKAMREIGARLGQDRARAAIDLAWRADDEPASDLARAWSA